MVKVGTIVIPVVYATVYPLLDIVFAPEEVQIKGITAHGQMVSLHKIVLKRNFQNYLVIGKASSSIIQTKYGDLLKRGKVLTG